MVTKAAAWSVGMLTWCINKRCPTFIAVPPDHGDHHSPPKFLRPHWPTSILPGRKSATRAQPIRDPGFNELWQWKHVSHVSPSTYVHMNIMNICIHIHMCVVKLLKCCLCLHLSNHSLALAHHAVGIGQECLFLAVCDSISFHWDQFQRLKTVIGLHHKTSWHSWHRRLSLSNFLAMATSANICWKGWLKNPRGSNLPSKI